MTEISHESDGTIKRRTGWAIAVGIVAAFGFGWIYHRLFAFVINLFAGFDPAFGTGIGALVLYGGAAVIAFLSSTVLSLRVFPYAERGGFFYGLSTFIVLNNLLLLVLVDSGLGWMLLLAALTASQVGAVKLGTNLIDNP